MRTVDQSCLDASALSTGALMLGRRSIQGDTAKAGEMTPTAQPKILSKEAIGVKNIWRRMGRRARWATILCALCALMLVSLMIIDTRPAATPSYHSRERIDCFSRKQQELFGRKPGEPMSDPEIGAVARACPELKPMHQIRNETRSNS